MTGKRKIKICPFCYSGSIFRRARSPRNYKCNVCKCTFRVPDTKEYEMKLPVPRFLRPKKEVISCDSA